MHAIISIIHQDLQKAILKYTRGIKSRQDKTDFHNGLSLIKQYYEDQGMLKKIDTSFAAFTYFKQCSQNFKNE